MRFLVICALALLGGGNAALSAEMTFRTVSPTDCRRNCQVSILAQGDISLNSYLRFVQVASRLPRGTPVLLRSPGGNMAGGMYLGAAFRSHRSVVHVPRGSICASACTLALLGGVVRRVEDGAYIGVHKYAEINPPTYRRPVAQQQAIERRVDDEFRRYVRLMGGDPRFVTLSTSVSHNSVHIMSPAELRRYRVVTGGTIERRATRTARQPAGSSARNTARRG